MHIKPRACLKARDLPLAESPFLAARLVKQALLGQCEPLPRFDPYDIPGFSAGARPEFLRARLLALLESGDLVLVHNPLTSGQPIDPHVVWKPDSSSSAASGKWVASSSSPLLSMANGVDVLNREGVTPEELGLVTAEGSAGHPSEMGDDSQASSASVGPRDHKLSLPVGAAARIAPLTGASERTLEQTDSVGLPLHITVGVFLDGTLNNVENIRVFKQRVERDCLAPLREDPGQFHACKERLRLLMGESYANAPTNVAKLFELYRVGSLNVEGVEKKSVKVYQPGVGTDSGKKDSFVGMATGLGETGIEAQVEQAFKKVVIALKDSSQRRACEHLTLDFFGFSRGAAAVRHGVNQVLKGTEGPLRELFAHHQLLWPEKLEVRFVGLFDTVAGVVNLRSLDFAAGNNRNSPIEMNLQLADIKSTVHLTALDERRANFSLNSICAEGASLPKNAREIMLPGAHSDIGGGYPDLQTEEVLLSPTLSVEGSATRWHRQTMEWDSLRTLRDTIKNELWIGKHCIESSDGSTPSLDILEKKWEHPLPDGQIDFSLRMIRKVRGEYSRVCCRLMHELASSQGVPFDRIDDSDPYLSIPPELSRLNTEITEKVLGGDNNPGLSESDNSFLRQRYIHYSDHFNTLEFSVGTSAIRSEIPFHSLYPFRPTQSRRRRIHSQVY
ncbi:DUF2235 domain-containing protein [Marinobacter alexandrii]|uniref:DUF2235 domain-containing protein n=1 Tax=Marinobacter alexandrii TaxID=2570351 RepID=UPI003262DC67